MERRKAKREKYETKEHRRWRGKCTRKKQTQQPQQQQQQQQQKEEEQETAASATSTWDGGNANPASTESERVNMAATDSNSN